MNDRQPLYDNELLYDEQIHPLMAQIIEICKVNRIPMAASFEYATGEFCSTLIPVEGQSDFMSDLGRMISRETAAPLQRFQITTENKDESKIIEVIL